MSKIITLNEAVEAQVAAWERTIKLQKMRVPPKRFPSDIAVVLKDMREYDTGGRKVMGAFPIFYKDNLEDILVKYKNVFAHEWIAFIGECKVQRSNLANASGMSKGKQFRFSHSLPINLHNIIRGWVENILHDTFPSKYWDKKLRELMPEIYVGKS